MKEQDYQKIHDCIGEKLGEIGTSLAELIGIPNAIQAVMNIYLCNDTTKGFGQDYRVINEEISDDKPVEVSVISSRDRLSIITEVGMSYYKADLPLCGYRDLDEDISNILIVIDTVFDRIASQ